MSTQAAATVRRGADTAEQIGQLQPQPGTRRSCGHARRGTDAPAMLKANRPIGDAIKFSKAGAGSGSKWEAKRTGENHYE
ncbi:MAG: hypothetical protein L6Q26_02040 [Anaerolineales bacterium]|nr:hypothetical protein [Anaerolineales bacterium]NUQ85495.1 hypothetical protein [Anaerolineales bacterium]